MKRVLVVSQIELPKISNLLSRNGFNIVKNDPDFVLCHGGDGTILFAERKFPQVPKLIIKKSKICRKCDYRFEDLEELLLRIRNREFKIKKEMKLEAKYKNRRLIGLNEIQLHAKLPIHAVRFSINYNSLEVDDLIGDGVVIATPFGSTAYYESTGGEEFESGIGISFNNLHNKKTKSFVISRNSVIDIRIDRGPALLVADNNEDFIELNKHDAVSVKKTKESAHFIYPFR